MQVDRAGLRGVLAGLILCAAVALASVRGAEARTLLRDPDIEYALRQVAAPLISAAGLSPSRIDVLVIQDDAMNAFIVNDRTVFIHSGLILRLGSAAELQGVIAHELAHIANGHISRRIADARAASRIAAIGLALGAATALAGDAQAGAGAALGAASTARASFLAHSREQEASADASGLRFMADAGVDPEAMVRVLDLFRGQEALMVGRQSPYVQGHPLTRDRLRAVKGRAAGLKVVEADHGATDYWFARAQGKLSAFLWDPSWTLDRLAPGDASDIAIMRRAVAYHRIPDPGRARAEIDRLAAMRPDDPFVHELRGQILLESRDLSGAIAAYGRAAEIAPSNALILAGYGRALLAAGRPEALATLQKARDRDPGDPRLLRDLAQAYAQAGQTGEASLATAERYAMLGRLDDAAINAQRAAGLLPNGSPGRRRADDIIRAAKRAQ